MKLINESKQIVVSKECKIAKSIKDRLFGLLLSSNPRTLIFKTRFGIHTYFLKDSIDVLILNKDLKVVRIKSFLKPNKLFFWNPRFLNVFELPAGSIKSSKTELGDQFKLA